MDCFIDSLKADEDIRLSTDIDASDFSKTVQDFSGILDGNGYTIYNLSSTLIHTLTSAGIIKNIRFKDVEFTGDSIGIVGENSGLIENVSVEDVTVNVDTRRAGVITCTNKYKIQDCSVDGTFVNSGNLAGFIAGLSTDPDSEISNCTVTGSIRAQSAVGGIAGEGFDIYECTVNANVFGNRSIGGITGLVKNSITNCTVSGCIEGNSRIGGLAGKIEDSPVRIKDCIVDSELKGEFSIGGLCGFNSVSDLCISNTHASGTILSLEETGCFIGNSTEVPQITTSSYKGSLYGNKLGSVFYYSERDRDINFNTCTEHVYIDIETYGYASLSQTEHISNSWISVENKEQQSEVKHVRTETELKQCGLRDEIHIQSDITVSNTSDIFFPVFLGTIHGHKNTIQGLQKPLFSIIGNIGTVKNITVQAKIKSNRSFASGALAESVYGICNTVQVEDSEINSDSVYTGGITGILNTGTFQNCTVTNTSVKSTSRNTGGLFSQSYGADVEQSDVIDCKIHGESRVGGICGQLYGNLTDCTVQKSFIKGTFSTGGVIGTSNVFSTTKRAKSIQNTIEGTLRVGGIVGEAGGKLVSSISKSDVKGRRKVGGICGDVSNTTIKECSTQDSTIYGENQTGGLIGELMNSEVERSFVTGKIQGESETGGLIGACRFGKVKKCFSNTSIQAEEKDPLIYTLRDSDDEIVDCYWNIRNSEMETSKVGTEMSDVSIEEIKTLLLMNS